MPQPYHHGALRAALLAAAEAILDRDGIAALTLRATAREAGVSHAAPRHHFADLTSLLSALATAGFIRFRDDLHAEAERAGADPAARLIGLGGGYLGFAGAHPGLFQLMFRSERLDWSSPDLAAAADAAFALLSPPGEPGPHALPVAIARWSLVHGLANLLIDGRIARLLEKSPGRDRDSLIAEVLASLPIG